MAWQRGRRSAVKYRQRSERTQDGYRLSAEIDEFGGRWHISGRLAGVSVGALGHPSGAESLDMLERAADEALTKLVAAGLEPDPIWMVRR
jgi:hypothetical protein